MKDFLEWFDKQDYQFKGLLAFFLAVVVLMMVAAICNFTDKYFDYKKQELRQLQQERREVK